ncbi:MAG: hypothetical protein A2X94_12205 [Bdellovibrionales bacterium GWB1_55_8]|nr:MAG: hypothetical protein A2X94_12205 [Bdellovibrionales bacterium GWB1_55_8]
MRNLRFIVSVGIALLIAPISLHASGEAGAFDFLNPFDVQPSPWIPESPAYPEEPADPVQADLTPFYGEFEKDGIVTMYVSYGIGTYYPARGLQIFKMLKALAEHYSLPLVEWELGKDHGSISFRDSKRNIRYSITIGYERNEYIQSFSNYEVVMYHGHSRYGQGPAFQHYQNYFRIGRNFESIEVDGRNIYFKDEPILKTELYAIREARIGSRRFPFQYRGQKDERSELPKTSYTKNIPGKDVDWKNTRFLPGRQIFYFYSCSNRQYWRDSIRELHPDIQQKLVFGTFKLGYGATKPEALMIISIVNGIKESSGILDVLNSTKDCDKCFTTF